MTTDNKLETGGPAFPLTVRTEGPSVSIHGMTTRTYAAIHLRVPMSEHDWLNDMIRESHRNELAKAAMVSVLKSHQFVFPKEEWRQALATDCYLTADAMLAEQGKK